MKTVGLKVLKNKLSAYVRLAASGETVLVTDRDRVVAELVPPQPEHKNLKEESIIERGVREGWIKPATVKGPLPPPPAPIMTLEELLADLDRDRADRDLP
jgi:antitoxin (DNA-binding transcriptional repressor) of toxin-antitoxin stability system